ncbi:MAG: acyltransferase family protein [Agriterribacter sp.]
MKRLHYLDNLMIFLSMLVILHHVSIGYGTMGGWCYVTPEKLTGPVQVILSALSGVEASFSMCLFFFISAYLTIPSLEKKGLTNL